MKTYHFLHSAEQDIRNLIKPGIFSPDTTYLVRIYTAIAEPEEAVEIACTIQQILPRAQIVGSSTCGVIFRGEQSLDSTLIVIEEYEYSQIYTETFVWKDQTPEETAKMIADACKDKHPELLHVLFSDHYFEVHQFVEAFNELRTDIKLTGGLAGDILSKNVEAYVFTPEGCVKYGAVVAGVYGSKLKSFTGVNIAHEPISAKHCLTENDGEKWIEVNGILAEQWISEQLGVEIQKSYESWEDILENDILAKFPMVLENHHGATRFLKYDYERRAIVQYDSYSKAGTEFRIGYVSPTECVKETFRICNEIMERPIESLFCYSCMFRRIYLHNCARWELLPYKDSNLCGAFVMGEIAYMHDTNEFLNGSCCLVGTAENEVYIRPDINVFETLNQIEDDNKDLLNFVLKRQSQSLNQYNEQLLERLLIQQKQSEEHMYLDNQTGLDNYLRFKQDRLKNHYNKICMIKIENAELLMAHLEHEVFIKIMQKAIQMICCYVKQNYEEEYYWYSFSEHTFFMVAESNLSAKRFTQTAQELYQKFRLLKVFESGEALVNRFVVVLNREELVEYALNALQASKNMQLPFFVCEPEIESRYTTDEEFKMIGVLNRAIENDGVTPYFQGIYDNQKHCINRYEALMRIKDVDGTVYTPAYFMDIAKKYHLYTYLSQRMIEKVFALFDQRSGKVSINFSVYDIESVEMQEFIFKLLKASPQSSKYVLEILEDEEFRDMNKLKEFIAKIKAYGVKVAIDDFGAGYSNLLEIASIAPDYLKIDGSIIKNLHKNQLNQKILDIVIYISKVFDSAIIAEFVENDEIQKMIASTNIRYSQGYYFSTPQPFERLPC